MEQRKILFKAKRLDNNQWAKGSLVKSPLGTQIVWWEDSIEYAPYIDPSTVSQFTGLKDCNGQDVYENDILEHINNTDIKVCIEWCEHRYVLKEVDKEILHLALQRTLDDLVVIGNKFDRKEEK